jgi:hypothetical protein
VQPSGRAFEGVWTPRSVLQINVEDVRTTEQHRLDVRSISIQQGVVFQKLTLFGKSLQSVRTTWQHIRTISSNSDNSIFLFERGNDFSEDRPDPRSSRPNANLIRIELRCFLRISQKSVRTWQILVRTLDKQSPNPSSF